LGSYEVKTDDSGLTERSIFKVIFERASDYSEEEIGQEAHLFNNFKLEL
jgi:hypothetical protein